MKYIKWGIIGCGKYVQENSGPALNNVIKSSVHAVMRRDIKAAKLCARKLNAPKYYNDYEKLIEDRDVNAVYIASPPGFHLKQALLCAKFSKPVYIEKPMARNLFECEAIVNEFNKFDIPLYVSHYRRAHEKFQKIKSIIDSCIIGKVTTVNCQLNRIFEDDMYHPWYFKPPLSGGGKFVDISPHMIDILIYLFGKIENVNSYCVNLNDKHNLEDAVVAILKFCTNTIGTLNYNLLSSEKNDKIICIGKEGRLEFSIHGTSPIIISKNNKIIQEIMIRNPENSQMPMVKNVVKDLIEGCENVCYGMEALETYRVIDLILNDFYKGRNRNFWEDFN